MNVDEGKGIDSVYRYVGNRLRHYRRERGLKQAALAEVIGVSPQQYQKYEDAQSKCSLTNLLKLADFLSVDIRAIMPMGVDSYGEPAEQGRERRVLEDAGPSPAPLSSGADLTARLVSAFMTVDDTETRERLVLFIESLARGQSGFRSNS